jgi:uncharacterized 2Fe-2S/4Fe-4S cluster protein (DUF4445 family)
LNTNKNLVVRLDPIGLRVEVQPGTTLLEAAQLAGIDMVAACGGAGICGTCLVELIEGKLTEPTVSELDELSENQLNSGLRMACQAVPLSDIRVNLPTSSLPTGQQLQLEGIENAFEHSPNVLCIDIHLPAPTIEDLRSDLTRVNDSFRALISGQNIPSAYPYQLTGRIPALKELSARLRSQNWSVRLAVRQEKNNPEHGTLIGTYPIGERLLGLAVDMGSTKLAVYLIDLESGVTLSKTAIMNPQISYGEDIVSRIAYANQGENHRFTLQKRLVDSIQAAAQELCRHVGADAGQIVDVVMVGNTAIHHFFTGLPVRQLGSAPYIPAASAPLNLQANEIGLKLAVGAQVHLPANIAGFVGADHTAALLSSRIADSTETKVLVDIGTNTEISLAHEGKIMSCSTASGPAFEGAHIHDGMRAAAGAIDRITINNGTIEWSTIQAAAPIGMCGTGILTAISEMLRAGLIDRRGTICVDSERLTWVSGKPAFVLVPGADTDHGRDIVITRKDINEIQLAKSAIRTGIEILLQEAGIRADDVQQWVIAGAFGTYLDLKSAVNIGMFPDNPLARFLQIGNAAGIGAKEILLSVERRKEAEKLADKVKYIELTVHPEFTGRFIESMYF